MSNLKTRSQLATELQIDRKTLYNKLKKSGLQLGKELLNVEEQRQIYALFGIQYEEPEELKTTKKTK